MNSVSNLAVKCAKYERELVELEITIGSKYALLNHIIRDECATCVNNQIIDLSRQIGGLKKQKEIYQRHIMMCQMEMRQIKEELGDADEVVDVDDADDVDDSDY